MYDLEGTELFDDPVCRCAVRAVDALARLSGERLDEHGSVDVFKARSSEAFEE